MPLLERSPLLTRRTVLRYAALAPVLALAPWRATASEPSSRPSDTPGGRTGSWFDISLAQWSLHRAYAARARDPLRFAADARREFGLGAVEYVNRFYQPGFSPRVTAELLRVANGEGVRSVLMMCDHEGNLGDPDDAARAKAVANHVKWLEAARTLGCHSIRVNAASAGTFDEQVRLAADGLRRLTEIGETWGVAVIVENHGGLSSNGAWLAAVIRAVDHPGCGTLPDFGNFVINKETGETYDPYRGTAELLPFARGVSAKTNAFRPDGGERDLDYPRLLGLVKNSGYRGHIGIEWAGPDPSEPEGIRLTRELLERLGGRAG